MSNDVDGWTYKNQEDWERYIKELVFRAEARDGIAAAVILANVEIEEAARRFLANRLGCARDEIPDRLSGNPLFRLALAGLGVSEMLDLVKSFNLLRNDLAHVAFDEPEDIWERVLDWCLDSVDQPLKNFYGGRTEAEWRDAIETIGSEEGHTFIYGTLVWYRSEVLSFFSKKKDLE